MTPSKQTGNVIVSTLVNSLVIGCALDLIAASPTKKFWLIQPFLVCFALFWNGIFTGNRLFIFSPAHRKIALPGRLLSGVFVIYLAWQAYQDYHLFIHGMGRDYAIDFFLKDSVLFLILISIFWGTGSLPQIYGITAVIIGIGFWATCNLVLDRLGKTPFHDVSEISFGASRFGSFEQRWYPPLSASNWSCSAACAVVAMLGLLVLAKTYMARLLPRNGLLTLGILVAIGASLVLVARCQFRTQIVVLPLLATWLVLSVLPRLKKALLGLVVIWFLAAPFLLAGTGAEKMLDYLQVDQILKNLGTKVDSQTMKLSGRADLYANGLEKLTSVQTVLLGEGPSLRDARKTLAGTYNMEESSRDKANTISRGQPYHSGLLDLVFSYGGLLASVLVLSLVLTMGQLWRLVRNPAVPPAYRMEVDLTLFYFTAWLTLSCTDPGIFGYFDMAGLALIPLLGALRYAPLQLPQRTAPARYKTRPPAAALGATSV